MSDELEAGLAWAEEEEGTALITPVLDALYALSGDKAQYQLAVRALDREVQRLWPLLFGEPRQ